MNGDHRSLPLSRIATALTLQFMLALCCLPAPAGAQRLSIRTFSVADGLGSSFVSHVMQDSAGYLWFATRDGLSRWNGYDFSNLSQPGSFSTPAVDQSLQTRSGEYFVICNDGSLYSYLPVESGRKAQQGRVAFRRRTVQFEGKDIWLTRLYEDSHGTLWGGGHGVLIKGLGAAETAIPLNRAGPPYDAIVIVAALLEDRAGSLWIGTNAGLFRLLPSGKLLHLSLGPLVTGGRVNALTLDHSGRIWVGYASLGVVVLAPGPAGDFAPSQRLDVTQPAGATLELGSSAGHAVLLTTASGLPDSTIAALLTASDGQVWIGTGKGLVRFDGAALTRYTKDDGLCDNIVHSLSTDGDGNLWVATPSGVMRVVLGRFSGYTVHEGLATDHIASIGESPDGTLYAIGRDWSINQFEGRRFRASYLPLPEGSSLMWASQAGYRDEAGRWWALTNEGLYRFQSSGSARTLTFPTPGRVYTARDGLPNSSIFRLFQDRSGALWVGTRSGDPLDDGLARFDATLGRAVAFHAADGFPPQAAPSAFVEDRQGSLWIGLYRGGLVRYREGRFRVFARQDGIPPGMVTGLIADRNGRLWISTNEGGIGRMDDPSADSPIVRTYSTEDGLASNNVRALVEDGHGRIFAGSVRGVDRLDPATGRIRHYGTRDGLVGDFVTAAFRDSRGDLWFGTYGGISRLRPDDDDEEAEPPPIAITGLRVAGEAYPVLELGERRIDRIELAADQRDIAIDFLSVSRHHVQGIAYQYSIDAANASWSRPTTERSVHFARLPPGDYRFAVRAVSPGQRVSPVPATVLFSIRPPLWQRWWVISLAVATLGTTLLGLYRYRVRKLLEMERLRVSIASDLHDEIATNLSSIAMFSTLVQAAQNEPSPFLERITTLATASVEAIREIIWSVDSRRETTASLLVRLRDEMVASCRARGLHLTVVGPDRGAVTATSRPSSGRTSGSR